MESSDFEQIVDETAKMIRGYCASNGFGSAEGIVRGVILRYECLRSSRTMTEVLKEWDSK